MRSKIVIIIILTFCLNYECNGRNYVQNGSFETASAPNIPDYWGLGQWGLTNDYWIGHLDELWRRWKLDNTDAIHGKQCMRVDGIYNLESTLVYVNTDTKYVFSAFLKSEKPDANVMISFTSYPDWKLESQIKIKIGQKWEQIKTELPVLRQSQIYITFKSESKDVFWVDAVQIEEGNNPRAYEEFAPISVSRKEHSVAEMKLTMMAESPKIDGMLDDACWQKILPQNLKTVSEDEFGVKTIVQAGFDADNLYLAFTCYDNDMNNVLEKVKQRDDAVWQDDSLEIFITPNEGINEEYFHFAVNIYGTKFDAIKIDPMWSINWQAVIHKDKDKWFAEIAIPFNSLSLKSSASVWRANFCRNYHNISGKAMVWSPTFGKFHNPERFGKLQGFDSNVIAKHVNKTVASKDKNSPVKPFSLLNNVNEPFFGFGLAWQSGDMPGPNAFAEMKKAKFNSIVLYCSLSLSTESQLREILDLAQKNDIKVLYWIGGVGGEPTQEHLANIKKHIETFKDCPAISAWMVLDEPHANPEYVSKAYELAKVLDPVRPAFINLTPYGLNMKIAGLPGDILAIDTYPINFDSSTIADVGKFAAKAYQEAIVKDNRPTMMFLQGMSNCLGVWRGPNPDEMTAQTYAALIKGVTGIYYFSAFIWPSNTWERTRQLAEEVQELKMIILTGTPIAVSGDNDNIVQSCFKYQGAVYIIAVNTSNNPQKTVLFLENYDNVEVKYMFEDGRGIIESKQMEVQLGPYERKIFWFKWEK